MDAVRRRIPRRFVAAFVAVAVLGLAASVFAVGLTGTTRVVALVAVGVLLAGLGLRMQGPAVADLQAALRVLLERRVILTENEGARAELIDGVQREGIDQVYQGETQRSMGARDQRGGRIGWNIEAGGRWGSHDGGGVRTGGGRNIVAHSGGRWGSRGGGGIRAGGGGRNAGLGILTAVSLLLCAPPGLGK